MNSPFKPVDSLPVASEWKAYLTLDFAHTSRGVRLKNKDHLGPLYVQKPFYPEGLHSPHVYLLHPPGGMVSGDELTITVNAAERAEVLVTTPGAGRVYRARTDRSVQRQQVRLNVADGGAIEWLPLEAILFPDANAELNNSIQLSGSGKVIYQDVVSLGLPANGQTFERGCLNQNIEIWRDGRLLLQERLRLDDTNRSLLEHGAAFAKYPVQGVLIAGPFAHIEPTHVHELQACCAQDSALAAVSMVGEFVVVRTLGACSESARTLLERCWTLVRPVLLGKDACPPRIWRT